MVMINQLSTFYRKIVLQLSYIVIEIVDIFELFNYWVTYTAIFIKNSSVKILAYNVSTFSSNIQRTNHRKINLTKEINRENNLTRIE